MIYYVLLFVFIVVVLLYLGAKWKRLDGQMLDDLVEAALNEEETEQNGIQVPDNI